VKYIAAKESSQHPVIIGIFNIHVDDTPQGLFAKYGVHFSQRASGIVDLFRKAFGDTQTFLG
jgi:hypothetical protein